MNVYNLQQLHSTTMTMTTNSIIAPTTMTLQQQIEQPQPPPQQHWCFS